MKHMDGQLKEHATDTGEQLSVILQNLLRRGMVLKDEEQINKRKALEASTRMRGIRIQKRILKN